MKTRYANIPGYLTKDGSLIRELFHPNQHGNKQQSLAEAQISQGKATFLHIHHYTEELYHVISGTGDMTLGAEQFYVERGDTILIPPHTPHCIANTGQETLVLLCCCAPPYSHQDTELL